MKMKLATTLFASCALLLSLSAPALSPNCSGGCKVKIIMSAGCGSGIKVAPDPIVVPAGQNNIDIVWQIDATGWSFDDDAIFIHQPGESFTQPSPKASKGKKEHAVKHSNKKAGAFKYDINLLDANDGKTKCKLDPTIVDQ